jgi:integrase/recombinase XerD
MSVTLDRIVARIDLLRADVKQNTIAALAGLDAPRLSNALRGVFRRRKRGGGCTNLCGLSRVGAAQRILAIPIKRSHTEVTHYLSRSELAALIDAPDRRTSRGRRDSVLLLFLARTGARVSEALNVDAADLQLGRPHPQVLLWGKGRKQRMVPLPDDLAKALEELLRERGIGRHDSLPLFVGRRGQRLTRFGATHIVRRAVATASKRIPRLVRKHVSPHVLRHSLAMTLLQSGVDLLTIQAWLGHAQVATTHRYASADVQMMRRGLEQAGVSGKEFARFQPKDEVLRLLEQL